MNDLSGPDRVRAKSLSSTGQATEVARIDYTVISKADCGLVWRVFSQCEQWNRFLNAYGTIKWWGDPWAPGSRLQIELLYPVAAMQSRVITVCNPPRCVAWINHVLGYTMEQWVLFDPHASGGTRISTWIELTGATLRVDGHDDVQKIVRNFVRQWYTNFAAECDGLAEKA